MRNCSSTKGRSNNPVDKRKQLFRFYVQSHISFMLPIYHLGNSINRITDYSQSVCQAVFWLFLCVAVFRLPKDTFMLLVMLFWNNNELN